MTKTIKNCKPKDREASETRLLEAAKEVFSQHGFNGATTRMIAQKADVNLALINRYFDGKYGLLLALLKQQDIAYRTAQFEYPPQDSVVEEICCFCDYLYNKFFADILFSKIVLGQFFSDEKFLKEFRNLFPTGPSHPVLEERLRLLVEKKKMSDKFNISQIASEIETTIFGFGTVDIMINGRDLETSRKNIREFLGRYAKGLLP